MSVERKFLIHCGFAKCGSTALQDFFSKTFNNYLGFIPSAQYGEFYKSSALSDYFEQTLRFGSDKNFKSNYKIIKDIFLQNIAKQNGLVVFSNENIVGRYSLTDLPDEIKFARLIKVIPENSIILIVFRDVEDLLFSYYKMLISFGYVGVPSYFFSELNLFAEISGFWDGFDLELVFSKISSSSNNHDLAICMVKLDEKDKIKNIFAPLNIGADLPLLNQGLKIADLQYHFNVNMGLMGGKRFLDWFEIHRVFPHTSLNQNEIFRLSRTRHTHENIHRNIPETGAAEELKDQFIREVPEHVKTLTKKNREFAANSLPIAITKLYS